MIAGDVEGCAVQPISQSQFTPLPEALCWVIWELNMAERSTALEHVVRALANAFPDLVPPTDKVVYDTLGKLIRERKVIFFSSLFLLLESILYVHFAMYWFWLKRKETRTGKSHFPISFPPSSSRWCHQWIIDATYYCMR